VHRQVSAIIQLTTIDFLKIIQSTMDKVDQAISTLRINQIQIWSKAALPTNTNWIKYWDYLYLIRSIGRPEQIISEKCSLKLWNEQHQKRRGGGGGWKVFTCAAEPRCLATWSILFVSLNQSTATRSIKCFPAGTFICILHRVQ